MKYASQKRVLFEVALIKLCKPQMETDYESVVNRIHNLEQQLKNGVPLPADAVAQVQAGSLSAAGDNQPAPEKKLRESAVPQEVRALVGNWQQVLNQLDPVSKNMLNHVTLTVDDSGALVVAFGEDTSYSYFASEDANKERLIQAASETIGKEVRIEFRFVADRQQYDALPELRGMFDGSDIVIETMD